MDSPFQVHAFANQSTLALLVVSKGCRPCGMMARVMQFKQTLGLKPMCLFWREFLGADLSVFFRKRPVAKSMDLLGGKIHICCAKGNSFGSSKNSGKNRLGGEAPNPQVVSS